MHDLSENPLLQSWEGPIGLPPFDRIKPAHFKPALAAAMRVHQQELDLIAKQDAEPDFDNTIAAFDRSGRMLARVESVFHNLTASHTCPELQAVQREMAGPLAAHASAVYLHAELFARVDALHRKSGPLELSGQQQRLLQRIHFDFVSSGALLQGADRQRLAAVKEALAQCTTQFGQNVLHHEVDFRLVLRTEAELAGLPGFVRDAARQAAIERGMEADTNAHVITLSRSLVVPFLSFSERRDLREQAWRAWVTRGESAGEHDNRELVRKILRLRSEMARLLGYESYADYALVDRMAARPSEVSRLLDEVWPRALQAVQRERAWLLQAMHEAGQAAQELQAWDWLYWAEKVRASRFALDDNELKPYFELERMVQAAFDCAHRLFGLRFEALPDVQAYHPDVRAYEVRDAQQRLVGLFLQDNFARPSKRSGAWMSSLRWQNHNPADARSVLNSPEGEELPLILNNNNFAKGVAGSPTLLSLDDVRTLFHEFGHGLHGLLSQVNFQRLSGTQVLRDFVELPSQLFEHWMSEPAVLKRHARHAVTGAPISDELLHRIEQARLFNQGYETVRYTASALVDMALHSRTESEPPEDVCAFEREFLQQQGLPAAVGVNHRVVHFQHLFSGSGYAAGYYVYLWAEVLEADAYEAFVEAGDPFDPRVAQSLARCIYSSGNSLEPSAAFAAFRGRGPVIEPMLRQRGLV